MEETEGIQADGKDKKPAAGSDESQVRSERGGNWNTEKTEYSPMRFSVTHRRGPIQRNGRLTNAAGCFSIDCVERAEQPRIRFGRV